MKKQSTSLAIKAMQMKTTLRFHLTAARMTIINKINNVNEDVGKRNTSKLLVGM
jgi:hypothetical protein